MSRRILDMRSFRGRSRVGLGISTDSIRAVAVRDRAIVWALEAPLDTETPLAGQIAALLARIPRARGAWTHPSAVAAVGPAQVQTKRLSGVPPTTDARIASAMIREGASRFFMVGAEPIVTSGAWTTDSGDVWAAAFEQRVSVALESACTTGRVALGGIIPSVAVIPAATTDGSIVWRDGETCVEIGAEAGVMRSVVRVPCTTSAGANSTTERIEARAVAGLEALGEEAMRFADAYGAAVAGADRHALSAPLIRDGSATRPISRRRAALAVSLCAASIVAAVVAPGIAAERAGRAARAELGALAKARGELHDAERNLGLVSGALGEVAQVESRRRSALGFLAQLTSALPEGSAVVTLRIDSVGGTVVALTPQAASLVNRLDTIPLVVGPEIVGPVTREIVAGRDLERVTVRFLLSRAEMP